MLSSEKKRKVAVSLVEELGAEINGGEKSLGASSGRLLKVIHLTLLLLSKPFIRRKELQILLGRWVFILQFRRPGMSVLNDVWCLISGKLKQKKATVTDCRRELFLLVCLVPLLHANLAAKIAPFITASDASNTGGDCAIGKSLTKCGWDFFRAVFSSYHFSMVLEGVFGAMILGVYLFKAVLQWIVTNKQTEWLPRRGQVLFLYWMWKL